MTTTGATLYQARQTGALVIEQGQDNLLTLPVYRDGTLVAPASGTVTIYNAANTAVVSAAAVSVSNGIARYTVTTATLAAETCEEGWRAEWSLVLAGDTHIFRQHGALVYRRLYPPVTDEDLQRRHTDLARLRPSSEASYQDYLDEAWSVIEARLIGNGKRPWLVLDPFAFREVHLYLTLALIYRDFAKDPESTEWKHADRYEMLFAAGWDRLSFPQASPTSGTDEKPGQRRASRPTLWLGGRA